MNPAPRFFWWRWLTAALWPAVVVAQASLLDNSPFLPPDWKPPESDRGQAVGNTNPVAARMLEFRAVYSLGGRTMVYLFDLRTQKGEWSAVGEAAGGWTVRAYDEAAVAVEVELNGSTERLTMKRPSDTPLPVQTAQAAPSAPPTTTVTVSNQPGQTPPQMTPNPNAPVPAPVIRRRVIVPGQTPAPTPPPPPGTPQTAEELLRALQTGGGT